MRAKGLLRVLIVLAALPSSAFAAESPGPPTPFVAQVESGFRGIWYAVGPSGDEYAYKYSGGLGTYCAKHRPFAVYRPEVEKTFFCYGGALEGDSRRLVHDVSYFDHRSGEVARPRRVIDKATSDAHDNPVISIDDAGYLWLFSTSHGRDRPSYIHRSADPYTIDRWVRIDATYDREGSKTPWDNFSYVQIRRRPGAGFAVFFTRYKDPAERTSEFMTSEDGVHWNGWRRLASVQNGHYQVSTADGSQLATMMNFHPSKGGVDSRTNLYYIVTPDGGKTWRSAGGETIDVPLTSPDNPALVRDYKSVGKNVYLKDLRFDHEGRPVALVIVSNGYKSGPAMGPREWTLFRWRGGEWIETVITSSDNNYDMGELAINGAHWRLVAPTAEGPQAFNPGGEMAAWVSDDAGNSWRLDRQLTHNSLFNHSYARRPVDAHPDFFFLWADGDGRKPSESRLYFANQAGDVFQLPTQMKSNAAKPKRLE